VGVARNGRDDDDDAEKYRFCPNLMTSSCRRM
jgi:hypothetical protein